MIPGIIESKCRGTSPVETENEPGGFGAGLPSERLICFFCKTAGRTIHTFHQTLLAFYVEYNRKLFDLWRNGRTGSPAFQLCQRRINDLRGRIPEAQRVPAMRRFLTDASFFTHNGSKSSLFLGTLVPTVLYQEETR